MTASVLFMAHLDKLTALLDYSVKLERTKGWEGDLTNCLKYLIYFCEPRERNHVENREEWFLINCVFSYETEYRFLLQYQ